MANLVLQIPNLTNLPEFLACKIYKFKKYPRLRNFQVWSGNVQGMPVRVRISKKNQQIVLPYTTDFRDFYIFLQYLNMKWDFGFYIEPEFRIDSPLLNESKWVLKKSAAT